MAYEETSAEREDRKAREAANRKNAYSKEKAAIDEKLKPIREAGEEAVKGMSEGRMDAMGNPTGMKKGGKIGSASKRADGIAQRGKTKGRYL
jgi:hypothetical protein